MGDDFNSNEIGYIFEDLYGRGFLVAIWPMGDVVYGGSEGDVLSPAGGWQVRVTTPYGVAHKDEPTLLMALERARDDAVAIQTQGMQAKG